MNFAPVRVKRMDYFRSTLDGILRLKLQNNQEEKNYEFELKEESLTLYECNGNEMNFAKIYDA